ncbi:MAG: glycine zipper 2TM domain-containing protein [Pseudomonadota bacterium]
MDPVLDTVPARSAAEAMPPGPGAHLKPLWAAIGVLGIAVVALGGTLVYQNTRDTGPAAPPPALAAGPASVAQAPAALARQDTTEQKAPTVVASAPAPLPSVVQAPRVLAPHPYPPQAVPAYPPPLASAPPGTYSSQPVAVAAPVCAACGRIESVTPVHRAAPTTGVGAVAGGVLGAVVGNQFGHGSGRTVTTLLGAGGGAYLGNTVEQHSRSRTVYQVHVRMDNGTRRSFERTEPAPVGALVTVEGHGFRLGRGSTYSSAPEQPYQQVAEPRQGVYSSNR